MYIDWEDRTVSMGIFKAKYAKDDKETPEQFCERVASIVRPELREWVKESLAEGSFCFGGRTLYMAGRKDEVKASSSNCYIMPMPEDNIESIYDNNAKMARIFTRGGGAGVNISNLRPAGAKVNNAAETSTGAISFLELYNSTGNVIGARGRRAAEMVVLNCDHPDVIELVQAKKNHESLQSMNISVMFTDEFMKAVKRNEPYTLHYHCRDTGEDITKTINAADFFMDFCEAAWDMGDPGVLFGDRINDHNLNSGNPEYFITASNPCSEFLGPAYSSCNLASLNLYSFVNKKFTDSAYFDFGNFRKAVSKAVQALNDVLDYGYDNQPLPENKKCIDYWRQIGLGVFGFADALVAMGIPYGSFRSIELIDEIFACMQEQAIFASCAEATVHGPFLKYNKDILFKSDILKRVLKTGTYGDMLADAIKTNGIRNASLISIAPTGTMSLFMGNYTGGLEPIFKLFYDRSSHKMEKTGETFRVYSRSIEDLLKFHNLPLTMSAEEIKKKFPFVREAHDIDWRDRVEIQSTAQLFVDNAISSTVNLPHTARPRDIYDIYCKAWEWGCKGITVFRDGCARGNILGIEHKDNKVEKEEVPQVAVKRYAADADYQVCPDCGEKLYKVEGHCGYCLNCGYSACSR